MTTRAQIPEGPADSLEDALIRRIATDYYPKLQRSFRDVIREQLNPHRQASLKERAIIDWQTTAAHPKARQHPDLVAHIAAQIIPFLQFQTDLAETLFLVIFFKDDLRHVKRAWCPSDEGVLRGLGFPYNIKEATKGLGLIRGLATWEVDFTEEDHRGLRGNLKHQYCSDLTQDQFQQSTYHPEGDWLVGIKSAVFLGIPVAESDFGRRVGQLCLASPVPNLFGDDDHREEEPEADSFFQPYLDCVPRITEPRPFCHIFQDCVMYRETGASQLASAWMIQTVALTHKHRREALYMDSRASRLEHFLGFALKDSRFKEVVADYNARFPLETLRPKDLKSDISFLRDRISSQRRFYEFLRHFSHQCLKGVGAPRGLIDARLQGLDSDIEDTDHDRLISFKHQRDFRRYIRVLASFIAKVRERPFQKIQWPATTTWEPLIDIHESGAIEFVIYQLLDNAEKNSPRNEPLTCSATTYRDESGDFMLIFELSNRIRVQQTETPGGACSRCFKKAPSNSVFKERIFCADCLGHELKEFFEKNHWASPRHTGGFGLFLVHQFVEQFYNGSLSAKILDGLPLSASFTLAIPVKTSQHRGVTNAI